MRRLRLKIVALFLLIGLVPLACASLLSHVLSRQALQKVIGSSQRDLTIEVMDKIDREIDFALTLERNWLGIARLLDAARDGG
ncbi:MAG: hypothetical protein AB1505_31170, partial [Candidatus Latescibacterota bacterium]